MDIYTAEIQIKKLLKYVEDIQARSPNMYRKSKDRLRELASNCIQVVHVISDILEDQTLGVDDVEFSGHSNMSDIYKMIDSMESEVMKMKQFVGYTSNSGSSDNSKSVLTREGRIAILKTYHSVLEKCSSKSSGYIEVDNCMMMLWRWFDARFNKIKSTNFHYNLLNVPKWMVGIVSLYGKSVYDDSATSFSTQFTTWIDTLSSSDIRQYAVPYDVYKFCSEPTESDVSLSSLVIWDILTDSGYDELFHVDDYPEYFPKEDDLYCLCAGKFPDVLDNYRDYKFDSSIISECKIRSVVDEV